MRTPFGRPRPDELAALRDERVRKIVRHAWTAVDHYRSRWETSGVGPDDVRGVADLPRLPALDRTTLQRLSPEEMVARGLDPDALEERRTSGSSGRPLKLWRGQDERRSAIARYWRLSVETGLGSGSRTTELCVTDMVGAEGERRRKLAGAGPEDRHSLVDVRQHPDRILDALRHIRPEVLRGYATVLATLAERLEPEDAAAENVRLVVSGSEILTPAARRRIAAGFDARVVDTYACHEVGLIAWECPETGLLHVGDESLVVELDAGGRPAAEGEAGEVVITALHSTTTPLVRYRNGDVAVRGPSPCPCGAPWSTLASVEGRTVDYLVAPDGSHLHAHRIFRHGEMAGHRWIGRYRMVQESQERLIFEVQPAVDPAPGEVEALEAVLGARTPSGMTVEVRCRTELMPDGDGKFRVVSRRIDLPA